MISSARGRLKTVFNETPDVAVKKFILTMKGGSHGLRINSRNLCARQTTGFLNLLAQNSRRLRTNNLRLNIPACRGGKEELAEAGKLCAGAGPPPAPAPPPLGPRGSEADLLGAGIDPQEG